MYSTHVTMSQKNTSRKILDFLVECFLFSNFYNGSFPLHMSTPPHSPVSVTRTPRDDPGSHAVCLAVIINRSVSYPPLSPPSPSCFLYPSPCNLSTPHILQWWVYLKPEWCSPPPHVLRFPQYTFWFGVIFTAPPLGFFVFSPTQLLMR